MNKLRNCTAGIVFSILVFLLSGTTVQAASRDLYSYLSAREKSIYEALERFLEKGESGEIAAASGEKLKDEEFQRAFYAYDNDSGINSSDYGKVSSIHYSDGRNLVLFHQYKPSAKDQEMVLQEARRVAGTLTGDTRSKVEQVNRYLIDRIVYTSGAEKAHSAYGAMINGKAVCGGYANAFSVICHEAGIPCFYIISNCIDKDGIPGDAHAWNIVQLDDGIWYEIDVTWNDADSNPNRYLCITSQEMAKTHTRLETSMPGFYDMIPTTSSSAATVSETFAADGIQYKVLDQDTVCIQGFSGGSREKVSIPETVAASGRSFRVTAVANKAFRKENTIKEVNLPNNVTSIGKRAFYKCSSLKKVVLNGHLKKVGKEAFIGLHRKANITCDSIESSNMVRPETTATLYHFVTK